MKETYTKYPYQSALPRCEAIALYIIESGDTVRGAAKVFRISKSTVHKDITKVLKQENHTLYLRVSQVLQTNKQERHIRGGLATRDKYRTLRQLKAEKQEKTTLD